MEKINYYIAYKSIYGGGCAEFFEANASLKRIDSIRKAIKDALMEVVQEGEFEYFHPHDGYADLAKRVTKIW